MPEEKKKKLKEYQKIYQKKCREAKKSKNHNEQDSVHNML